jgi:hypothetical protein
MSIQYEKTFQVAHEFICAVVNNDESCLSDDELRQLDTFLLKNDAHSFSVLDNGYNETLCDISGLFSQCYKISLIKRI